MAQDDFLIKKMAELEAHKDYLEREMAKKATQEEISALMASLESITASIAQLQEAINSHASTIESLQVSEQVTASKSVPIRRDLKSINKGTNKISLSASEFRGFIRKAISAPYTFTGEVLSDIDYMRKYYAPGLVDLFLSRPIQGQLEYMDITSDTFQAAYNSSQGCFTPVESDANLQRFTLAPTTFRGFTKVCDTTLEDYDSMIDVISELLIQSISRRIDNVIFGILVSQGIPANTAPSWTTYANSIPSANLYDVAMIHSADISNLSEGKHMATHLLINPIDMPRVLISKQLENYINPALGLESTTPRITVYPTTSITAGTYVVVSQTACRYHPVRETLIEISNSDLEDFKSGTVTVRASERGTPLVRNSDRYGIIHGDIATSITNYSV